MRQHLIAGCATLVVASAGAGATDNVNNVLNIESKTVSVIQNTMTHNMDVTVVKGQSFRMNGTTLEDRDANYVFGAERPEGDPGGSAFRVVTVPVAGTYGTVFNAPSLITGYVYCRLEDDEAGLASLAALEEEYQELQMAIESLEPAKDFDGFRLVSNVLNDRAYVVESGIDDAKTTQISLALDQPENDDANAAALAFPWWPLMITHLVDGGVPGTDVIFQAEPKAGNPDKVILRVFLVEGTSAMLHWTDINNNAHFETLALGQFIELEIDGLDITTTQTPVATASNQNYAKFVELTGLAFEAAMQPPSP